ncbi:Clp protease N-terminal domain-containing protein, partial [Nocardia brasiliensis]|uniref:Clp protease N-terminal domain-containing protein n=1 Tax=Nocardia brasiliensis TaxID=37326 RepID=UPI0024557695
MFERFSRSARMAIVIAQEDARELRSPTIEVEHVLLGLLSQCEAELRGVLAAAGLTHAGVTQALAEAAVLEALRYSKEREAFGRPIGKFQH